jgi:hypothetical protein
MLVAAGEVSGPLGRFAVQVGSVPGPLDTVGRDQLCSTLASRLANPGTPAGPGGAGAAAASATAGQTESLMLVAAGEVSGARPGGFASQVGSVPAPVSPAVAPPRATPVPLDTAAVDQLFAAAGQPDPVPAPPAQTPGAEAGVWDDALRDPNWSLE